MYFTYVLRCKDGSLYTGITTDVPRRMKEHASGKGARCTRLRGFSNLEAVWSSEDRSRASRLEYRIKQLTKSQKEELVRTGNLEHALGDKLNAGDYERREVTEYQ